MAVKKMCFVLAAATIPLVSLSPSLSLSLPLSAHHLLRCLCKADEANDSILLLLLILYIDIYIKI